MKTTSTNKSSQESTTAIVQRKRRRSAPSTENNRNSTGVNRFLHIARQLIKQGYQEYNIQGVNRPLYDIDEELKPEPTWPQCRNAKAPHWTCADPALARVKLQKASKYTGHTVLVEAAAVGNDPSTYNTQLLLDPYKGVSMDYVHRIETILRILAGKVERADELFTFVRIMLNLNIVSPAKHITIKTDFDAYLQYLQIYYNQWTSAYGQ